MRGSSSASALALCAMVLVIVLLGLSLAAEPMGTAMEVIEGLLALFVFFVGLRVAGDVRGGRA